MNGDRLRVALYKSDSDYRTHPVYRAKAKTFLWRDNNNPRKMVHEMECSHQGGDIITYPLEDVAGQDSCCRKAGQNQKISANRAD